MSHSLRSSLCQKEAARCLPFSEHSLCFFHWQGVDITAVIIKNVELPANISEQMSGKTLVISSVAEQKMNQQSDMQQVQCGRMSECKRLKESASNQPVMLQQVKYIIRAQVSVPAVLLG